jgi:hypothetical protein
MTLIPVNSAISTGSIGSQNALSTNDIISLNKAYSCAGTTATYGGGNSQVRRTFADFYPHLSPAMICKNNLIR